MLGSVKDRIRATPWLYDILMRAKRRMSGPDRVYDFFDPISRAAQGKLQFVQIGANDGLRNDPIREFVVRDRWNGVFVEPLPDVFELLKRNYAYLGNANLKFVNAAIATSGETDLTFYTFDEDFLNQLPMEGRLKYLRKSSFDKEHVLRWLGPAEQSRVKELRVPCLSMQTIFEKHCGGRDVDLLVCDAEGYDSKIIQSIDYDRFHPKVIFFESHNVKAEKLQLFEFLNGKGYDTNEIGGDTAAVRRMN